MFLSKKRISRRTVLRGARAAIALPLLDAMVPAQTPLAATAAHPKSRLACIEMVHGAAGSAEAGVGRHYWSPAEEGKDFEFSFTLEPLKPFREYVTIISGTDASQANAQSPSESGADHFRSSAVFLTAAHPKQTAGPDVCNGTSIDQMYAQWVGRDTRVPSLQLCAENIALSGAYGATCGYNYNCVYSETISWASPTRPLAMTVNPRAAFEQLFGARDGAADTGSVPDASVLDSIGPETGRLQQELGPGDRRRMGEYLEEIRRIEQRIERIERQNAVAETRARPGAPLGVPDSWEEHVKLMFDLQTLAFASETTRVSAFKMSRDTSNRVFAESGVETPFHTLSHHCETPARIAEFAKLNRYHVGLVPYFLEKLKSTPDGDGNLLDHSLVLYGSAMGDSNLHSHRRVPLFLAGHASGALRGNLHCVCADGTPQANALLTVMRKLGVEVDRVGDSTGEIAV